MVTGLPGILGISLATRSTSLSGISITRPTSRMAARGSQRAKGDDLGHFVIAVLAGGVFEHLRPAVVAEIQVDIRHGDAPRVEEALEDQPVLDGIDQGDIQGVGHDRAGCRAAGVVPDALLAGVAAQVPHDQEVGVEPHLVDDAQLVIQALAHDRVIGARRR